jgi:hypothetical protein
MQGFYFYPDKGQSSDPHSRIAAALMSQMPTNVGQGLMALGYGIADHPSTNDFPAAPGTSQIAQGFRNMLGMNNPTPGGLW